MTPLDASSKRWDTAPKRLVASARHRVHDEEVSRTIDSAQGGQSKVHDDAVEHLERHPWTPWMTRSAGPRERIVRFVTQMRRESDRAGIPVAVAHGAATESFEASQQWDGHDGGLAHPVAHWDDCRDRMRSD